MISLVTTFWIMIVLFGIVGFLRGWTKEVIALAGLVLSLFAIHQFGFALVGLFNSNPLSLTRTGATPDPMRTQFSILAIAHLGIAFFSYQGAALAGGKLGSKDSIQERLLGAIVGSINGYLVFGGLWSLLEYRFTAEGYSRIASNASYALSPTVIRPAFSQATELVLQYLPLPFLAPYLTILIVLVVLFLIVVII